MGASKLDKALLSFLKELKQNNNRPWFEAHKSQFKDHQATMKQWLEQLITKMNAHDQIEKYKLFRIYRDVRFSKDKTPYKPHFAASFAREGAARRGGYYLRVRPGESFMAVGFWDPNKDDLLRIRKELELDAREFRETIEDKTLHAAWGTLQGDAVKTAPKGFDKEHPDIDLIRHKQFIFVRELSDKEVTAPDFMDRIDQNFKAIRPWFDLMSDILTTDLNGVSLLDS